MVSVLEKLPDDVVALKKIIVEQATTIKGFQEKLVAEQEKYAALQRLIFGPKSEKHQKEDSKQALLFNEAETFCEAPNRKPPTVLVGQHERKKAGRKPFPDNLERNEIVHALSNEERTCPCCGALRPEIGEERKEELRLIPARAVIDVHIMKKYGPCPCKECHGTETAPVIQAPGNAKLIPGSRFSNGTIAFFLTSKFVDAQPFYRMEGILSRWGVDTGRSTLCSLAMNAGRAIGDLVQAVRDDLKASPVIGMDETPVQVLHEKNRSATAKSYMWVACGFRGGKKLLFFHYHPTRSGSVATEFLKGYSGYLQTDGYAGYSQAGEAPGIIHVGCMAHIRRKFFDADKVSGASGDAAEFLSMISAFYHTESLLRQRYEAKELGEAAFLTERRSVQEPQLVAMHEWLRSRSQSVTPSSGLGKAVSYALGQWDQVVRYLEHALLTPDNNAVENAIRPFVLGRKNWLFSNTQAGAHTSAGLYSLIETAKANGHEPYKYLCYLFDLLPKAKTPEERLSLLPYRLDPSSY